MAAFDGGVVDIWYWSALEDDHEDDSNHEDERDREDCPCEDPDALFLPVESQHEQDD